LTEIVMRDAQEKGEPTSAGEYNAPDVIRSLRGVVDSTEDREQLRRIDSQLRHLLVQIKNKMGIRGRVRSR
jgi:hypothetical protein